MSVQLRLHNKNLSISRSVKAIGQVLPDVRIAVLRGGMLICHAGEDDNSLEVFYRNYYKACGRRLEVATFCGMGYSRRVESLVRELYVQLAKLPSVLRVLDDEYHADIRPGNLICEQIHRLKIHEICATRGIRHMVAQNRREFYLLGSFGKVAGPRF